PQDAGIIQAFKSRTGALRAQYMVDKFDKLVENLGVADKENVAAHVNKLHNVSLFQALDWAKDARQDVTQESIVNCWRHS
ncbi:unnamed protein product, partial [Aphanomyces euteiches]